MAADPDGPYNAQRGARLTAHFTRRRSNRPLLKTPDPEATVDRLLAARNPVYAEADIHVQSRDVAHEIVIGDILAALGAWLETDPARRESAA